jgi:hypothetical protein
MSLPQLPWVNMSTNFMPQRWGVFHLRSFHVNSVHENSE